MTRRRVHGALARRSSRSSAGSRRTTGTSRWSGCTSSRSSARSASTGSCGADVRQFISTRPRASACAAPTAVTRDGSRSSRRAAAPACACCERRPTPRQVQYVHAVLRNAPGQRRARGAGDAQRRQAREGPDAALQGRQGPHGRAGQDAARGGQGDALVRALRHRRHARAASRRAARACAGRTSTSSGPRSPSRRRSRAPPASSTSGRPSRTPRRARSRCPRSPAACSRSTVAVRTRSGPAGEPLGGPRPRVPLDRRDADWSRGTSTATSSGLRVTAGHARGPRNSSREVRSVGLTRVRELVAFCWTASDRLPLLHGCYTAPAARIGLGVSPSAARGRLGQVDRAGARATSSTPPDCSLSLALAAVRAGCQTPEAPTRARPRPDHHRTPDPLGTRTTSPEVGALVQGGAPGRRRLAPSRSADPVRRRLAALTARAARRPS